MTSQLQLETERVGGERMHAVEERRRVYILSQPTRLYECASATSRTPAYCAVLHQEQQHVAENTAEPSMSKAFMQISQSNEEMTENGSELILRKVWTSLKNIAGSIGKHK